MKKNDIIIYSIFIFITILLITLVYFNKKEFDNNAFNNNYKYIDLTDYNEYFKVNNCIDNFILALENKNEDDLLKLYDESYIKKNGINRDNILDFSLDIKKLSYSYVITNIKYANVSNSVKRYYVKGYIKPYEIDIEPDVDIDIIEDNEYDATMYNMNLYVVIDNYTHLFSIIPVLDGEKND